LGTLFDLEKAMKPLPIDKAFQLYLLLADYLPPTLENSNFIGTIIENIKNSGNHKVYIEAIALMYGLPIEEVYQYNPRNEAPVMFAEGLYVNNIVLLRNFCKRIGLNA
jgi:hypothetical protein